MNLENLCKSNWSKGVKISRDKEKMLSEEIYTFEQTKEMLKKLEYSKYLGSGKQRTFIKEHLKMYSSIIKNTTILDNTKNINLRARIQYILEKPKITCECGSYSIYDNTNFNFTKFCKKCSPKFNSKAYFKSKNEENFEEKYKENMKAKVTDKLGQNPNKEAQEFANKKLACIDSSKTEEELKACKDKFPPQEMDALVNKK